MRSIQYPLIVSDFDGTLLRTDEKIAKETLDAIEEYRAAGGHFALCTGRTVPSAMPIAKKLGLTGLLSCFQGSVVVDIESGELVVDGCLPHDGAVEICQALEALGVHIHVYDTNEYYSNMDDEWLTHYQRISGVNAIVVDKEPLSQFLKRSAIRVRKLLVLLDPKDRERVYTILSQRFGEEYYVTYSAAFLVEVTNRTYSKATALTRIAEHYNVPIERTIAVGDSLNDLPMIVGAGLGIAVNNAEEALKEKAKVVLEYTNDENAIGKIIDRYGFINR